MDKKLLTKNLKNFGYQVKILKYSDINFKTMNFKNQIVLYTSSEDVGYYYKNYIEDIIYGLHLQGAFLIPGFKFLRANNNKVFMEILRDIMNIPELSTLKSDYFGVLEDLEDKVNKIDNWGGYVIKTAEGAMSEGVKLAQNQKELIKKSKKISSTKNIFYDIKDLARKIIFSGYKLESRNRKKFIIQEFVPELENDWKVLVFWDKIYILKRYTRKNDFRSSGSGDFVFDKKFPNEILEFSFQIRRKMNVPCISLDVCYDGQKLHILEYQSIYFGTTTLVKAPFYYKKFNNEWICIEKKSKLENVYTYSIDAFIKSNVIE